MKRVASVATKFLVTGGELGRMPAREEEPTMRGRSVPLRPTSAGTREFGSVVL